MPFIPPGISTLNQLGAGPPGAAPAPVGGAPPAAMPTLTPAGGSQAATPGSAAPGQAQDPGFFGNGTFQQDVNQYNLPQLQDLQSAYGALAQPQAQDAAVASQQGQLASSLFNTMNNPNASSVAQQQLQGTTQNNVANAYAMAQANPNNPAAARQLAENVGQTNQAAAGQAAQLRAQEVASAQGQLGNTLGQQRSQGQSENQVQLSALGGASNVDQAQLQANENQQAAAAGSFNNAASHSIGGQIMSTVGQIGGAVTGAMAAHGGLVNGKAPVPGDSYANDKVHALVSPGEVILPRSVVNSEDAPEKAKAFLQAIIAKRRETVGKSRKAA